MKLAERNIRFLASVSPDVVGHKFYYVEAPAEVTYESDNIDLGNTKDVNGYINVNLADLLPSGIDGVFNVGVAAIDDVGNESPMSKANNFPLDLVAPTAPGPIEEL